MSDQSQRMPAKREATGKIMELRPFHRLMQQMSLEAEIDQAETSEYGGTEATIDRIMSASEDEIWDAGDLANIGGRNLVDVEQTVYDFTVRWSSGNTTPDGEQIESKFRDGNGRGMYLLVRSKRLDNGEEIVWNTSAPDIVPKLIRFRDLGNFPLSCVIRGTDLGGGRTYLRLKPVPKRVVQ